MRTQPNVTHSYIGTVNLFDGAAAVAQTPYIHDINKKCHMKALPRLPKITLALKRSAGK